LLRVVRHKKVESITGPMIGGRDVDLSLSKDSYAMVHLEGMVALSRACGVPEERARAWLDSLQTRSEAGQFHYALPWTYVVAYAG
jgi:hypothetical protein